MPFSLHFIIVKPSMNPTDEPLVVRYLLGQLSRQERDAFDDRLLQEPDLVENLESMEDQLIRDAIRGDLPPDQQERFDRHFLSFPDLRRRYELTRALLVAGGGDPASLRALAAPPPRISKPVVAVFNPWRLAAIVAAAAVLVLLWQDLTLRSRLWQSESAAHAPRTGPVLSFLLSPGIERRDTIAPPPLRIPSEAQAVRLQLEFELSESHTVYEALVLGVEGDRQVWGQGGLTARPGRATQSVTLEIPAAVLPPGDYAIMLQAGDKAGNPLVEAYTFRVAR
jgi:hypothetical protein